MNIRVNIKIPSKQGKIYKAHADIMLHPFYITEHELLSTYLDKYNLAQYLDARHIVFSNSLTADGYILRKLDRIPQKEAALIRRQLALCLSRLDFGTKWSSDFIKSMTRSKTLASFQVTTTISADTSALAQSLSSSKSCIDDILKLIDELAGLDGSVATVVKGEGNCHNRTASRLWHHFKLPEHSNHAYANSYTRIRGRLYKDGGRKF